MSTTETIKSFREMFSYGGGDDLCDLVGELPCGSYSFATDKEREIQNQRAHWIALECSALLDRDEMGPGRTKLAEVMIEECVRFLVAAKDG